MMNCTQKQPFHCDDGGFSTVGMALALLITIALVFSGAQVYKVQSLAADVQNVADTAALAAENQVASLTLAAQVCDCAVLSLSLTGVVVAGVGAVCLCVPAAQSAGEALLQAAEKVFSARDKFAHSATEGLNHLQKLLPFISAAQAAGVAAANGPYIAIAVLLPTEGEELEIEELHGEEAVADLENSAAEIEQAARDAEEAAKQADSHKLRAWQADCHPAAYTNPQTGALVAALPTCMQQRAEHLAGMAGAGNPVYENVDAWSFSVALARAQAYYPRRLAQEAPANDSIAEQANSALRKRFYRFAVQEVQRGYVNEAPDGQFSAYFPLLFKNTSELRTTPLYTEVVYPVTRVGDVYTMHAYAGCPNALNPVGVGSIANLDAGGFTTCELCEFVPSSLGKVAAATTSTQSGFEHYYRIVAEEAAAYNEARAKQKPAADAVKGPIEQAIEAFKALGSKAAQARIALHPPGEHGAIAVAAATHDVPVASMFANNFVASSGSLGARIAIAGAQLQEDNPAEAENLITSLFDNVLEESDGIAAQGAGLLLDIWSGMLTLHAQGVTSMTDSVRAALDSLPLVSHSGLGAWAANKLTSIIEALGLEPAELGAYKPVLANTYDVASADGTDAAQAVVTIKHIGLAIGPNGNPVAGVVNYAAGYASQYVEALDTKIEIARIEILGDVGPSIPIEISVPPAVKERAASTIESARDALVGISGGAGGARWQ